MSTGIPELAQAITAALDQQSDVRVDPALAREQIGISIANAIGSFIQGQQTVVTGSSATGGAVTGTGIIQ